MVGITILSVWMEASRQPGTSYMGNGSFCQAYLLLGMLGGFWIIIEGAGKLVMLKVIAILRIHKNVLLCSISSHFNLQIIDFQELQDHCNIWKVVHNVGDSTHWVLAVTYHS